MKYDKTQNDCILGAGIIPKGKSESCVGDIYGLHR